MRLLAKVVLESGNEQLGLEILCHGLSYLSAATFLVHDIRFGRDKPFESLDILGKVVKDAITWFWVRSSKLSHTVLGHCLGSKEHRKLVFTVSQLSLSFWNTSRLSHQDSAFPWRMLANSHPFLLSYQVAFSAAILTRSMSLQLEVASLLLLV